MFIDTLEFTIPIDLCSLYATLQQEAKSQLEFPASVNSYGTTQDANVQVAVRANKVTFKVDGVSSGASIISKNECKTLKLSIFDVDRTLMQKNETDNYVQQSYPVSNSSKRVHEQPVSHTPAKSSRTSYNNDSHRPSSPPRRHQQQQQNNSQSKPEVDNSVNVKQEPEDPDCIEIEPDPEPDNVVPKKESPFMQIDYSSEVPHTQTSQSALERLSFPQSSHSSQSFRQNVPHVPDYSEPGPSQRHGDHGDQNPDDYLVFQDDDNYGDDNEADYSNDDIPSDVRRAVQWASGALSLGTTLSVPRFVSKNVDGQKKQYPCEYCDRVFQHINGLVYHRKAEHFKITYTCVCGKVYKHRPSMVYHQKSCPTFLAEKDKG